MMELWSQLLNSLAPMLFAIVSLSTSVLLVMTTHNRHPVRKRADYLLAAGNLLGTICWCLIYAETFFTRHLPVWDYGAPLSAFVCLLLIPVIMLELLRTRRYLKLGNVSTMAYGLSLFFQILTLYPGMYTLTLYLVLLQA